MVGQVCEFVNTLCSLPFLSHHGPWLWKRGASKRQSTFPERQPYAEETLWAINFGSIALRMGALNNEQGYFIVEMHFSFPNQSLIKSNYPAWSGWQKSCAGRRGSHLQRWSPSSPRFSLFSPPQFSRRWLPPSGHLSHPETIMNYFSHQFLSI